MSYKVSETHRLESTKDVYADALIALAEKNDRIIALEADLSACVGTGRFQKRFPERYLNCGIQEADMVGVAAGLSSVGFVPFVHTFGCFASRRVFDQVFISAAYARLNVRILGSDPGVRATYNGGTHMPFEDMGIMRNIPNATLLNLTDATMAADLLRQVGNRYGVFYLRYPRKEAVQIYAHGSTFEIGKGCLLREGQDAVIFASGLMVSKALEAAERLQAEGLSVAVADLFTWKPIDRELIVEYAKKTGAVVTSENHNYINGLGSAVAEVLSEDCPTPLVRHGVEDLFGEVGDQDYLEERFGLTVEKQMDCVRRAIAKKTR